MTQRTTGRPARTGYEVLVSAVLVLALVLAGGAVAGQGTPTAPGVDARVEDARIDGQIAAIYALNPHLAPYDVEAAAHGGVVRLTGTVQTDVERDLAAELARAVKGVTEVRNELAVADGEAAPSARRTEREQLRRAVADASTSAVIRSKLQANQNTRDLRIAVETEDNVVTLTGEVGSAEERELAELLVRNAQNVKDVRNELKIRTDRSARY